MVIKLIFFLIEILILLLQNATNISHNLYYDYWEHITKFYPGSLKMNTPFQFLPVIIETFTKSWTSITVIVEFTTIQLWFTLTQICYISPSNITLILSVAMALQKKRFLNHYINLYHEYK